MGGMMKPNRFRGAPIAMLIGMMSAAAAKFAGPPIPEEKPLSHRQRHTRYKKQALRAVHQLEQSKILNKMTNWQRNQWGKAGMSYDLDTLKHFASLQRPSNKVAA